MTSSNNLILKVLSIYQFQAEYSTTILIHLVRHIRTNIERDIYQKFLLQNVELISEISTKIPTNHCLRSDFEIIIWFMIGKYPTRMIKSKIIFEPLAKRP